ncbi:hypothetical protein CRG98_017770 [Punica granatum]|uniref:PRP1 splicing factor N-terminal domain-containing protein n=1 Tax=Punica granatum TaxID=22663 RepID=A0A2I0K010_PUNGR|nr:hypothetical protein CRG98_017770 [Punica granatum]
MPPRRAVNQRRAAKEDELDQRIEQIMDARLGAALEHRLDVMVDRLAERMGALMEARQEVNPRRGRVLNPTADLEDVEYDSYSEGDANIFIEDPFDDALFLAGGDGEPEFDEDDEGDDEGKDKRKARLKQEIEKYRASNQQMRTRISDVSIEPITAVEYFGSEFFPIIRSGAWANIDFRSSMEDVYVCVDNFISRLLGRILSTHGRMMR